MSVEEIFGGMWPSMPMVCANFGSSLIALESALAEQIATLHAAMLLGLRQSG